MKKKMPLPEVGKPYKIYTILFKHSNAAWESFETPAKDEEEAELNFLRWADSEGIIYDFYDLENGYTECL